MPYIDSNQDASQNDLFSKALLVGAVAIGAAAAGQMAFKGMAEKLAGKKSAKNGSEVLKGLYGKEANKLQKGIADNVSLPNWAEEGPQYALKSRGSRAPKLKRTNGTGWENFKSNTLSPSWMADSKSKFFKPADKDLAMFNKHLKNIHKGKMPEYSKSKLSMYEGIVKSAGENNINITGRDSVRATNDIYGSNKNYLNRKQAGINNIADDIAITNDIWGGGAGAGNQGTAEINAEIERRAKTETDAKAYQDLYNKHSGITTENHNRTGKMRDSYEDFWKKQTDSKLKNPEKRTAQPYDDPYGGNFNALESDKFLGEGADGKFKTDSSQFFGGGATSNVTPTPEPTVTRQPTVTPESTVTQQPEVIQQPEVSVEPTVNAEPEGPKEHPFSKYKTLSGRNYPPSEALTPEQATLRNNRRSTMNSQASNPVNFFIDQNERAVSKEGKGWYQQLNDLRKEGKDIGDMKGYSRAKYQRLTKSLNERKAKLEN